MNPPPPLPEEARHHANFANTTLEIAKGDPNELDNAILECNKALQIAPWWPEERMHHDCLVSFSNF
jgi:hypothetical protein